MSTKVAFISILTNVKQYCDLAITTITSYIYTNTTKIDWIILYEDSLDEIKQKLDHLQGDLVNLKFIPLHDIENQNYKDINYINIARDYCCKNFISRIFNINNLKDKYDVLCPCDFDILFVKDLKDKLDNIDFNYQMIGCEENNEYIEWILSFKAHHQVSPYLNKKFYINFGFAILICKNINFDLTSAFQKISEENKLKYLATQEQSFFAQVLDKIFVDNSLQLFMWNRYDFPISISTYYTVHFSVQQYLLEKIKTSDCSLFSHKYAITICYMELYKDIISKCKRLSSEFIDRINYNYNVLCKLKEKYPLLAEYIKQYYKLPEIKWNWNI